MASQVWSALWTISYSRKFNYKSCLENPMETTNPREGEDFYVESSSWNPSSKEYLN
jgi:hypothetical protein